MAVLHLRPLPHDPIEHINGLVGVDPLPDLSSAQTIYPAVSPASRQIATAHWDILSKRSVSEGHHASLKSPTKGSVVLKT